MIYFIAASSIILNSCRTKNAEIYNGASWGMSISEVQLLYKVNPSVIEPDNLTYRENLGNTNYQIKVAYVFDAKTGLKEIELDSYSGIPEDLIKNFEIYFINKQNTKLYDEVKDLVIDDGVMIKKYIYDRIYTSTNANVRSELVIMDLKHDPFYSATITFIPADQMWKELPSKKKTN